MEITNVEMERMMAQLEPYLERTDRIGYAAARNYRILRSETEEYIGRKRQLIAELGEPVVGEDGKPTGNVELRFGTEAFARFEAEIRDWALMRHEPALYTLPVKDAEGAISGAEILRLEWMFDWEG